ncbi:hypothetical protein, partial [Salmonella enterica]
KEVSKMMHFKKIIFILLLLPISAISGVNSEQLYQMSKDYNEKEITSVGSFFSGYVIGIASLNNIQSHICIPQNESNATVVKNVSNYINNHNELKSLDEGVLIVSLGLIDSYKCKK